MNIYGGDVFAPRAAQQLLDSLAAVYGDVAAGIEQFRGNQLADGVSGEPIEFLSSMHEQAVIATSTMSAAARRADEHCRKISDTVGSVPGLAGTQTGGYADPAAL